jgi:AraC-like DNA-binding protein
MKHVLKIIFKEDLQKIFDHFSSIFDTKTLFYSSEGEIIKVGLNRPNSQYCQLIQNKLYGIQSCLTTDQQKRNEAGSKGKTIRFFCHAGLREALAPIYSDGDLLGYMGFGQFRQYPDIPKKVLNDWVQKYKDPTELIKAYEKLPHYSKEKEEDILELFSIMVHHIVSQLHKIISYIHSHIDSIISLSEVSSFVGRSQSTISHLFKKKLNLSFKQTVMNIKFDKAEEYFQTSPHLKVGEVAEKIGYDDPLYFSRIYKKYRKISPSQFHKKFS